MIKISIGTDIVSVSRFSHWYLCSRNKLLRIFSTEEIDYCLFNSDKSAERFAVRFVAREALFKAICQYDAEYKIPFLTLCSSVIISKKPSGAPEIKIKEGSELFLYFYKNRINISLSLSHEKDYAVATVLLYSND